MEGTIHGFDLIDLVLDIHLIEHPLAVKVVMAGGLPQVEIGNVRGVDNVVGLFEMLFLPEIFNLATDGRALGMPEDQSSAGIFLGM